MTKDRLRFIEQSLQELSDAHVKLKQAIIRLAATDPQLKVQVLAILGETK